MNCNICGKPLTDPVSLDFGIGPVCRLKLKMQEAKNTTGNLFSPRAEYTYTVQRGVVCIVDHDNGKSVTNDIREVLRDIAGEGVELATHRVIYRDTHRIWDEVVLLNGQFSDFRSLNERELDAALAKLQGSA
jgi:uncharacterized protein YbaR (Trm112 family)